MLTFGNLTLGMLMFGMLPFVTDRVLVRPPHSSRALNSIAKMPSIQQITKSENRENEAICLREKVGAFHDGRHPENALGECSRRMLLVNVLGEETWIRLSEKML